MKYLSSFIYLIFLFLISVIKSMATDVTVYSEGGYSESTFIIKIFADIHDDADGSLISAGVKLTYPTEKLFNPVAVKNEPIWYFGSPTNSYRYLEPFPAGTGELVILLGKMDIQSPGTGVSENRILLSRVTFDRIENTEIPVPSDFKLGCGRIAPYTNFATVTGVDLDSRIVFNSATVIRTLSENYLIDSVRSLRTISMAPQNIPARSSELDIDNNNKVGLAEALFYLNKAAREE